MISVLFAARNSVYKTIPGLDVWDEDRDALNWPGGNPGIFHPPCRLFSRYMRHLSTAPESEKEMAHWAVDQVRTWGGILEHPSGSILWDEANLPPANGFGDQLGFSIEIDQFHWGHPAHKRTWLYICGTNYLLDHPVRRGGSAADLFASAGRKYVPGSRHGGMRSATPLEFAHWLIAVAERCSVRRMAV